MKVFHTALVAGLVAIVAAYGTVKMVGPVTNGTATHTEEKKESVYERVMRTSTLRCGYYVWPPYMTKDPNTGQLSGVFYDLMGAVAKSLSLKIEWVEETGLASFITALQTNRFDAYCSAVGPLPARAREADFSVPVLFFPIYAFARADDARFDQDIHLANDPSVILSTQEGEATSIIARTMFPKAKVFELQQLSSPAELFENVRVKKADLVFTDITSFREYDKVNTGKLKVVEMAEPLSVIPFTIGLKRGEHDFRQMINWALLDLKNNGIAETIYQKYRLDPKITPRPANDFK